MRKSRATTHATSRGNGGRGRLSTGVGLGLRRRRDDDGQDGGRGRAGETVFRGQHKTHFVTSLEQLPGKLGLRFDTIAINCNDVSERAGGRAGGLPLGRAGGRRDCLSGAGTVRVGYLKKASLRFTPNILAWEMSSHPPSKIRNLYLKAGTDYRRSRNGGRSGH